jgi:hypothetical protein
VISPAESSIFWSAHPDIHDKPALWEPRFGYGWQRRVTSLQGVIDHITSGGAFIAAAMTSDHRTAAAFESTSLVAIDVDYGLTVDEFAQHPLAGSACFVYTTPSHDPENGKHRFRVLFRLPEIIRSGDLCKAIVTILTNALGGDRSCTDPTRLFYGNSNAVLVSSRASAVLDDQIIVDAEAFLEQQRAACRDAASEVDEISILRAIHVLEQVLDPTRDGERDKFVRISAAARAGGDAVFPAWSDWASRSHHGSGGKRRQSSERWFHGLKGSSLGTLFFLASEQDPNWRDGLPDELRSSEGYGYKGHTDVYAGYDVEDFMGDPAVSIPSKPQPSMFDPESPWAKVTKPAFAGYDDEDFQGDAPATSIGTPTGGANKGGEPEKRGPGRPKKGAKGDPIEAIMTRLRNLYPSLRRNVVTDQVEFGPRDRPQQLPDPSTTYVRISRGSGDVFPKTTVNDLIQVISYENRYNPVKAYLEGCLSSHAPCPYFDGLATELLGIEAEDSDSLTINGRSVTDEIMRRFLIGAVARAMQPGCDMPWMPIFVGAQNVGKSALLRYLAPPQHCGPSWSTTVQQGITYLKDKPHMLHAGWIVVLDEVDRYFIRKYVEELKNIVSTNSDYSAKKYQNEAHYPRSFVMAGATNTRDFLVDPTGNRRFLPIIVHGKVPSPQDPRVKIIDLDRLQQDRDSIWAAAYTAYLAGEPWTFSSHELALINSYIDGFTADSGMAPLVVRALGTHTTGMIKGRRYVLLNEVMQAIGVEVTQYRNMRTAVSDEMKRVGWESKRVSIMGRTTRVWLEPERTRP